MSDDKSQVAFQSEFVWARSYNLEADKVKTKEEEILN